jgi:hypothetical protein
MLQAIQAIADEVARKLFLNLARVWHVQTLERREINKTYFLLRQ